MHVKDASRYLMRSCCLIYCKAINTASVINGAFPVLKKLSEVAGRPPLQRPRRPWFEYLIPAFLRVCHFDFFLSSMKICTITLVVSSEQSKSWFFMRTESCCRCCCCSACFFTAVYCFCCCSSAAAAVLLPALFVIVCRAAEFVAGLLNLIPAFFSLQLNAIYFLIYLLAVPCRIYGLSFPSSYGIVITGMRRVKAGVSLPRRKPPCKYPFYM